MFIPGEVSNLKQWSEANSNFEEQVFIGRNDLGYAIITKDSNNKHIMVVLLWGRHKDKWRESKLINKKKMKHFIII